MNSQITSTKSQENSLIGSQELDELFGILNSLFPEQDLLNPNSKYIKKVALTFKLMQGKQWTKEEFQGTLQEFSEKWDYPNWMPANLFDIKKRLYPDTEMVM